MAAKAKLAKTKAYGLAEAKARLSELVERAQTQGAQPITVRGRAAAYVVSAEEWEHLRPGKGTLLEFFKNSSAYRLGLEYDKQSGTFREVED